MNYKNNRPAALLDHVCGNGDNLKNVSGIVVGLLPADPKVEKSVDKIRILTLNKISAGPAETGNYAVSSETGPAAGFVRAEDAIAAVQEPMPKQEVA